MNPLIEKLKRDFSLIFGVNNKKHHTSLLKASWLDTILGPMIAIADETHLYLLEFFDRRNITGEIEKLQAHTQSTITFGHTPALESIEKEITDYFEGSLKTFSTPFFVPGSPFKQSVWESLVAITYGQTLSYKQQATNLGKPSACRAVANANGTNQCAIIIPCHRVITSSGKLGGYTAGIERKQWLLNHEKRNTL